MDLLFRLEVEPTLFAATRTHELSSIMSGHSPNVWANIGCPKPSRHVRCQHWDTCVILRSKVGNEWNKSDPAALQNKGNREQGNCHHHYWGQLSGRHLFAKRPLSKSISVPIPSAFPITPCEILQWNQLSKACSESMFHSFNTFLAFAPAQPNSLAWSAHPAGVVELVCWVLPGTDGMFFHLSFAFLCSLVITCHHLSSSVMDLGSWDQQSGDQEGNMDNKWLTCTDWKGSPLG